MPVRGVALPYLMGALVVFALAPSVAATHGPAPGSLSDALVARVVAAGELPLDALFLPPGLHGALAAGDGVDSLAGLALPGPSGPLLSDADLARLIHAAGGLPAMGSTDLARLLAAAPERYDHSHGLAATPGATTTAPRPDAAGSGASGSSSYAPDPFPPDDVGPASASAGSTAAGRAGPGAVWDAMSPAEKAVTAAGALGVLLLAPFAMYSRIRRDQALQNPTRAAIYGIVVESPGLCIKDLAERSGVSYSTATYHLDRLVKDGFVVAMDEGNRVTYFKNGGELGPDERALVPLLKNTECMRVFRAVLENPWIYRAQVAERLGVSHTTVNWHLKRLADAGLVAEARQGRACHLTVPTPALNRVDAVLAKLQDGAARDAETVPASA